jgi:hypothetical protein
MKFFKRISLLLIISILFISCDDDVIVFHLGDDRVKIISITCETSNKIIVKTNKFCDPIDLDIYLKISYRIKNDFGKYVSKNIRISRCKNKNRDCTKFEVKLKDSLEPGVEYAVYADCNDIGGFIEFVYTE